MLPLRAEQWRLLGRLALQILWPAFLMAGVMELLVFAMVDPHDLHWLGGEGLRLPRQAVYTLAFFAFWGVIAVAGAMTALLLHREGEPPS